MQSKEIRLAGVSSTSTPATRLFWKISFFLVTFTIIITVIIFILWPIVSVILKSIFPEEFISFALYNDLFTRDIQLLINSVFVSSVSTIICIFLSLCIAIFVSYSSTKIVKNIIFGMILLTMISPPFVGAMSYMMLFGRRGLITYKLLNILVNPYGWHGIVFVQIMTYTSLATLIIIGALQGVDSNLESSSLDCGASRLETLFNVTVPMATPGIIAAALITFINALSDFGTPLILGGGFKVLATEAYLNVVGYYNLPKAAAMSVLLLIPSLIVFIYYQKSGSKTSYFTGRTSGNIKDRMKLSKKTTIFLVFIVLIFFILILSMYVIVLWGAFAETWGYRFSLTLKHIKNFDLSRLDSFFRSLTYSLTAGIAGSIIGLLLAYILERKPFPGSKWLDFSSSLPYMIPGTFFGIGYLISFSNPPLNITGTVFIIIVNYVFRQLPVGTRAGISVLKQQNPDLEAAGRDLGGNQYYVFKDIVFPNIKPAFMVSFVNLFSTSMIAIGAIIFLVLPRTKVATVVLLESITDGNIAKGAIFANILTFSILAVNLLFIWATTYKKRGIVIEEGKDVSRIKEIDQNI